MPVTIIMTIITLFALFGDDIRILVTDKEGDPIFWIINIVVMGLFAAEVFILEIFKKINIVGYCFFM